jgi:hypothetical protein
MGRSMDEALSELEREAHIRMRCYDRWIQEGRVSRVDAWDRLERILSAISYLRVAQDTMRAATTPGSSVPVEEPAVETIPFNAEGRSQRRIKNCA